MIGWREVWLTRSMEEMQRVCDTLEQHGMEYRVHSRDGGEVFNSGRYRGAPGIRTDCAYEYRVYVPRRDAEQASHLLRR